MPEAPSLRFIQSQVRSKRYRLTKHATIIRLERGIGMDELERALLEGEIIERYPNDTPYPSCLVLGRRTSGDALHVVCSLGAVEPALRVVTVYEPEDTLWESDYRTRKVKKTRP